ncbi:MAG: hypothetical protein M3Y87_23930 [Myxococcota bacterium]|nr:hypothetical protein [Myxococcota bacterium]
MIRFAAAALLLAWAPSIASAQECAEGRARIDGRCCWPAQTWSAERARCEGAPRCPEALVEHGETCVAAALGPSSGGAPAALDQDAAAQVDLAGAPVPPVYRASLRAHWPELEELGITELARPVPVRGEDEGLIVASLVVFDVGWALGLLIAFIDEAGGGGCAAFGGGMRGSCNSWPFALLPIAGGITSGMTNFSGGFRQQFVWGIALGTPSVILQTAGLIMLGIALGNETSEIGYQRLADEPRRAGVTLTPGAPGADVGLGVDVVF